MRRFTTLQELCGGGVGGYDFTSTLLAVIPRHLAVQRQGACDSLESRATSASDVRGVCWVAVTSNRCRCGSSALKLLIGTTTKLIGVACRDCTLPVFWTSSHPLWIRAGTWGSGRSRMPYKRIPSWVDVSSLTRSCRGSNADSDRARWTLVAQYGRDETF